MRADHQRWAMPSPASTRATITVATASLAARDRFPWGMAWSMIERASSAGASPMTASTASVATNRRISVRCGRANAHERRASWRSKCLPFTAVGSFPIIPWGPMRMACRLEGLPVEPAASSPAASGACVPLPVADGTGIPSPGCGVRSSWPVGSPCSPPAARPPARLWWSPRGYRRRIRGLHRRRVMFRWVPPSRARHRRRRRPLLVRSSGDAVARTCSAPRLPCRRTMTTRPRVSSTSTSNGGRRAGPVSGSVRCW